MASALRFTVPVGDNTCKVTVKRDHYSFGGYPVFVVLIDHEVVGRLHYIDGQIYGYPDSKGGFGTKPYLEEYPSPLETYDIFLLGQLVYRKLLHPHKFLTNDIKLI